MPHQCLKCGRVFEEGSSELLKGCPTCNGNRFFFTKEPLDEKQRSEISNEVGRDLSERLMDAIDKKGVGIDAKAGKWVTVKPDEVRQMFSDELADAAGVDGSAFSEEPVAPIDDGIRDEMLRRLRYESKQSAESPETIEIERPGDYAIDVRGLLEKEPIIIEKDGSYSIHLPSVFKLLEKSEEK